jgi:general stress protein CsbA
LKNYGYVYWVATILTVGVLIGNVAATTDWNFSAGYNAFSSEIDIEWPLLCVLLILIGSSIKVLRPSNHALVFFGFTLLVAGGAALYYVAGMSFINGLLS